MKTGKQTVYILLEKGTEDKALYREIEKVAYGNYKGWTKRFFKEFPLLGEMHQQLRDEISGIDD